jgi:2-oxoglutarate/2-oxoacid ferredoxin oxidoreductase subunit alpha
VEDAPDERIRAEWAAAMEEMSTRSYRIIEVPMEAQCLTVVDNARKGKNMFALGVLAWIYDRDVERIREEIAFTFRKKSEEVYQKNVAAGAGHALGGVEPGLPVRDPADARRRSRAW